MQHFLQIVQVLFSQMLYLWGHSQYFLTLTKASQTPKVLLNQPNLFSTTPTPPYCKSPLKKSTMLNGLTIGLF